jgi:hypothetical protein
MPLPLYLCGKSPWYPENRRLGAVEKRKFSCPCQESNPSCPACNPLIYCLSYLGLSFFIWKETYLSMHALDFSYELDIAVKLIALLLCIWEVLGLNPNLETGRGMSWFSSYRPNIGIVSKIMPYLL